jgi:DNA-binding response OmpR family regulator
MSKRHILLVDDEDDLRRILRRFLEIDGYAVTEATNGEAAIQELHRRPPDLVLLDILMPGVDGWTVLERIRDVSDVPVLILSARAAELDKVRGLHAGADDYVTKPFGRHEVLARITALMRRTKPITSGSDGYTDAFLTMDFRQGSTQVAGRGELRLTPIEFRLLAELVRHADQIVSQDRLLEAVWGDHSGLYRDQVKLRVSNLRRKLRQSAESSCIETVRGFGYRYRSEQAL